MRFILCLAVTVAHALRASASPCGPSQPDLQVKTTVGTVEGIVSNETDKVRVFRGIPYAEAPVGSFRFRPPVKKTPTTRVVDATKWGASCPQQTGTVDNIYTLYFKGFVQPVDVPIAEDCLDVNVWAPRSEENSTPKPVLIFIHGGGYINGAASFPYYDGTRLVRDNQDVIFVSFNYRLNIFGFPSAAGLHGQHLNPGLLDQRLAIEWVRDNIAAFGGDPTRMLLFGESAGAASVDQYTYAYPHDPIVSAVVPVSGVANGFGSSTPVPANFTYVAQKLGCPACQSAERELACMQSKPWEDIKDVLVYYDATQNGGKSLSFEPAYDGETAFPDYNVRLAAGRVARLPMLIGNNDREGASLAANPLGPNISETVKPTEQAIDAVTNGAFNCPAANATAVRASIGLPVWRYRYMGVFPNLDPFTWVGAFHSSPLPTLFNTADKFGIPNTAEQDKAALFLQSILVNFVKDPENGLTSMGIPPYDPQGTTLAQLVKGDVLLSLNASTAYDQAC